MGQLETCPVSLKLALRRVTPRIHIVFVKDHPINAFNLILESEHGRNLLKSGLQISVEETCGLISGFSALLDQDIAKLAQCISRCVYHGSLCAGLVKVHHIVPDGQPLTARSGPLLCSSYTNEPIPFGGAAVTRSHLPLALIRKDPVAAI